MGRREGGLSCGECLILEGELVNLLPSGVCPQCGADYRDMVGQAEADQALVEVARHEGEGEGVPERGHRGTQYYNYPEGKCTHE